MTFNDNYFVFNFKKYYLNNVNVMEIPIVKNSLVNAKKGNFPEEYIKKALSSFAKEHLSSFQSKIFFANIKKWLKASTKKNLFEKILEKAEIIEIYGERCFAINNDRKKEIEVKDIYNEVFSIVQTRLSEGRFYLEERDLLVDVFDMKNFVVRLESIKILPLETYEKYEEIKILLKEKKNILVKNVDLLRSILAEIKDYVIVGDEKIVAGPFVSINSKSFARLDSLLVDRFILLKNDLHHYFKNRAIIELSEEIKDYHKELDFYIVDLDKVTKIRNFK